MRHYRYATVVAVIGVLILSGAAFYMSRSASAGERAARSVVEDFGKQLKNVSLTAEPDAVRSSIADYYAPFVTQDLLRAWQEDASLAPGRDVSSPWPDRVEVTEVRPQGSGYLVSGAEILMTSVEQSSDGNAGIVPFIAQVIRTEEGWRIATFQEQIVQ